MKTFIVAAAAALFTVSTASALTQTTSSPINFTTLECYEDGSHNIPATFIDYEGSQFIRSVCANSPSVASFTRVHFVIRTDRVIGGTWRTTVSNEYYVTFAGIPVADTSYSYSWERQREFKPVENIHANSSNGVANNPDNDSGDGDSSDPVDDGEEDNGGGSGGGGGCNNGVGNGGDGCDPGNSGGTPNGGQDDDTDGPPTGPPTPVKTSR